MWRRLFPLLALAALVAGWAVLAFVPSERLRGPGCQVRTWTGLHCPGCGGVRAARNLARGEVVAAARNNILVFPIVLAGFWGVTALAVNRWLGRRWWTPERLTLAMALWALAVVVAFTVVRNLEAGAFLRP